MRLHYYYTVIVYYSLCRTAINAYKFKDSYYYCIYFEPKLIVHDDKNSKINKYINYIKYIYSMYNFPVETTQFLE